MAVIKAINSKASIGRAINYITDKEKTDKELTYGKDCVPETAIDEMKVTKEVYGKKGGREYIHLVQSFDPSENVTFEKAHEIGIEFIESCEKYKDYEVLMSTHMDKEHIHNHFIVNSVSFEDGRKLSTSAKELQQIKDNNDRICKGHGLSTPELNKDNISEFSMNKYKALERGFEKQGYSYLVDTAEDVSKGLQKATNREEFISIMNEQGYKVNWSDTRKHITFENSDGKKVRNSNLEKTFKDSSFSKEGMEQTFKTNLKARELQQSIPKDMAMDIGKTVKSSNLVQGIQKAVESIEKSTRSIVDKDFREQEMRNQNRQHQEQDRGMERVRERGMER